MIQWKLDCRSRKQKRKTQPIARAGIEHCHWFILPLLLATPTMQFSLDRKGRSHKQNQCSASDSVGLIFTRSYRFTLLITTPTTTPSLVKTSLKKVKFRPCNKYSFGVGATCIWSCAPKIFYSVRKIKSWNDMKAVETMEIKALIVSKSTYSLIKSRKLIFLLKFLKLWPKFCEFLRMSSQICDQTFFFNFEPCSLLNSLL